MLHLQHAVSAPTGTAISTLDPTSHSPLTTTLSQIRQLTATLFKGARANLPFLAASVGAPGYRQQLEVHEAVKATTEYLTDIMFKFGLKKHHDGPEPGYSRPNGKVQVGYFTK